ncbi:WD repeat domain phosphoinositide-interacting protein 4 isoform X1 [Hydra vulgaris]|uniref:WD repeat domain phosphoinositide-interacting protein 4 n=1 Tax=Hydra vulgaris TaxID=6087 RepID=T2M370_HYDVU|nr:WD repeat domain phosphoinositide-interacting protein 4-like isoform X2 [Hydra vulgaris]
MSNNEILHLSINSDGSCFIVGTDTGFRCYNIDPLWPLLHQDLIDCGGVTIARMLKRTNLIAIVGNGRHMKYPKNKVYIWDAVQKINVFEYIFSTPVLNVKLRNDMILVTLHNKVYAYSFPNSSDMLFCYNTRDNPTGICEVSNSLENQWCVVPGTNCGSIRLVNLNVKQIGVSSTPCIINAHQHKIACVAINQHGTLVATASETGTLIRVFDIKSKIQTIELRRGTDPATLYCISFSSDSSYLCASSDKGTVHIFALKDPTKNKRSTFSKVGLFGNYTESQWGLANFSVQAECPCLCLFGTGTSVIAISYNGSFHRYVFTKEGNCNRESYDLFLELGEDRDL